MAKTSERSATLRYTFSCISSFYFFVIILLLIVKGFDVNKFIERLIDSLVKVNITEAYPGFQ